jgi:hypothetical protein
MSTGQSRLELMIDVFEKTGQRAMPLPTLMSSELVEAILQEFRELEYLGDSPANYSLLKAADETPLNDEEPLRNQLAKGSHLVLVENEASLPENTARPSDPIYLRDQVSGKVYKLHWCPAIIGRPDKNQLHNDRVAVDLETYKTGLRVSRRHAQITEENGRYFIQSMSKNPTSLKREDDEPIPVTEEKRPLQNGDIIHLVRSNITLKFIVRQGETE